ncbi:MAG: UvrD-helicase domain-containing protein [Betaproteobacteria bacterium]
MSTDPKNRTTERAADTGKSVHLSASAGSGKTRALKDRYLALLDVLDNRGLNIDQAVAITFTDKAAAEIKERVMHDLPETMLKKIIRGKQDLRISTIHSFCMNLLKRYPLQAGLPPDFGVFDARDQAYKIQKAIEDALEESDRDQEIMGPLRKFTADDLIATVAFLLTIRSRLKRMEIDAGGAEGLLRAVRSGMGVAVLESEIQSLAQSPEWRALFMQMELFLRSQGDFYEECNGSGHLALSEAKDIHAAYRIAESLIPLYFTQKAEPRQRPPIPRTTFRANRSSRYAVYEKLYAQVQDVLSRFLSGYRRAQACYEATGLIRLFQRAEENYQNSKLREGLLDFDDLEIHAYGLLQGVESPDILYWLDRRILHFLVDEFQDTSDMQWAILNKLTEEIFAGLGADKLMSPTLFVVGDEKQSIYRFREANYRLIEDAREKMEKFLPPAAREILTLHKNFRSTPQIINTVNQVFFNLWGDVYQHSEADRIDHKGTVRLIELTPGTADETSAEPTEAKILARELKSLIERGTTVYERTPNAYPSRSPFPKGGSDKPLQLDLFSQGTNNIPPLIKRGAGRLQNGQEEGWQTRPAGYGDCAILIQSRAKLKEYEAALQTEGMPFRVVGGIGFYEEDEIQALINVLFFLWNRDDKFALAAALKSPLFGFTDQDVFDLRKDGGDMINAVRNRRPREWELLRTWMNLAGLVPLAGLIHRIVEETGAFVRFGRRNPQAIFNIDKLLDTAREFDRRGYTTLQDFVEWVRNIREAEQREATADMNLPGFQGAVSIMTVHKAKGLEFPIVLLPGMNQQPKSTTSGPLVIVEGDGGVRMAVKDAVTPLYAEMWEKEKEELRREHQRLLYVAMTRARDHLVMIGTLKDGKKPLKQNTWLDYLHAAAPKPLFDASIESPPGIRVYSDPGVSTEAGGPQKQSPLPRGNKGDQEKLEQSPEKQIDVQQIIINLSPIPPSKTPEWKRATDFIDHDREAALELLPLQTSVVSPLTRGSVLHRCLEEYTKTGSYDLGLITAGYPDILSLEKESLHQFINDAESVLTRVLTDKELAWIFGRGGNAYAELPFLYKRGNALVSGIIDRLIIMDDKGYVIDFKAILIEDEEALKAWRDHYRPQIQIYCEAVKDVFRLRSVEGSLLFLDSARLELTTKV